MMSGMKEAVGLAIEATRNATTLAEARDAYYRHPRRDGLFGMVAFALWDGFSLELATTLLGLCGQGEFPSESQTERVLSYVIPEVVGQDDGDVEPWTELLLRLVAATEEKPAEVTEEQFGMIGSFLAWESPRDGEAEKFLCGQFPNTLSLIPIMEQKLRQRAEELAAPSVSYSELLHLLEATKNKIAKLESRPQQH